MKVLITGVAGFIGSNLTERLLSQGHSVIGVDNLSHGKLENIKPFIDNIDFDFHMEDVEDFRNVESFDAVVHLASEKIPRYSDSYATLRNNYLMTSRVVDLVLSRKARLLFASTSDIYGKNETIPFKEDSEFVFGNSDVKRWAYAVSKLHSEHFIIGAHDHYGLDYTIMRFFSCYGKNQAEGWWGGVQSAFMDNVIEGKSIEIHGSGMQSRCFTYIDDVVDGIILCLTKEEAKNQIFNIGNPSAMCTVYGMSKLVFNCLDKAVPIEYIPYASLGKYEDSKAKFPNIDKAKQLLGYSPKVNLLEGVDKTIKWKKKQYESRNSNNSL